MRAELLSDLIYLKTAKTLPVYLREIQGFKLRSFDYMEDLKAHLARTSQSSLVVIELSSVTPRYVEYFLRMSSENSGNYFIFIAQVVDNSVFQIQMSRGRFMVLREEEAMTLKELVQLWKSGRMLFSRRSQRQELKAPVMVKKSKYSGHSPTGAAIQALSEGQLCDFSAGGAKLLVKSSGLKLKDFVSLMYLSAQGQWVSVEAQLRWVEDAGPGRQVVGVQFLAISA